MEQLRKIVLECNLNEELKWGTPCYTFQKANVVLIHSFKEYCALLFFKGVLLSDSSRILIQQTENVQVARQIRFTNLPKIIELNSILKSYIIEAIEVEKGGLKADLKKPEEFKMVEEFRIQLHEFEDLKKAFELLSPGRQRAYLLHFSAPKQSITRESRIQKSIQKILAGKGLDD